MEYIIENKRSFGKLLRDLIYHRQLFLVFAWKELKLKYRQTLVGFTWVVLQPLVMMAIFTVVFAPRIGTSASEIPYPVYVFASLIIYNVFAGGVSTGSNTLLLHAHIIKKTYFPRIILPASSIINSLVDFLASLVILFALMKILGHDFHFLTFLACSLVAFLLVSIPTLGFGILFSGLNVSYRDVNFIYPFFLQVMLFISPIIYPIQSAGNVFFKWILMLNPISGAIEVQKLGVQPGYSPEMEVIYTSLVTSLLVLVTSIYVFIKVEKRFPDIL